MISKEDVTRIAREWLEGKDYFLVDVNADSQNRVTVEIDHPDGVWIEDCVNLHRFIEQQMPDRDTEDYELEVGSAGLDAPLKVPQQFICHTGREVEVLTAEGKKLKGTLTHADDEKFGLQVMQKMLPTPEAKRPKLMPVDMEFAYNEVKYTKIIISFK